MKKVNTNALVGIVYAETGEGMGITKKDCDAIVRNTFEVIASIAKEGEVSVSGFGKFLSAMHEPRQARNPKTGEVIDVPATRRVKFRPSKILKDYIAS